MKLVIDTNRLIAALIKAGLTREIVHSRKFKFYAPEGAIEEMVKHKAIIAEKSGLSLEEIGLAFVLLLQDITIVSNNELETFIEESDEIMKNIDLDDSVFIACALATKSDGIFSHDKHFSMQNKIKVWKTEDLLKFLK